MLERVLKDKTALIFSSSYDLAPLHDIANLSDGCIGKHHPNRPTSKYFSDFILMADKSLSHNGLADIARHELEHKMDFDSGTLFSSRFKDNIPVMIEKDSDTLKTMKGFVSGINEHASSDVIKKMLVLGKKRGINTSSGDIETLKQGLLEDISHIETCIGDFAPEFQNVKRSKSGSYTQTIAQWAEIPAVLEELKGRYGRSFIDAMLPQLSRATTQHRNHLLRPDSSPEREARAL